MLGIGRGVTTSYSSPHARLALLGYGFVVHQFDFDSGTFELNRKWIGRLFRWDFRGHWVKDHRRCYQSNCNFTYSFFVITFEGVTITQPIARTHIPSRIHLTGAFQWLSKLSLFCRHPFINSYTFFAKFLNKLFCIKYFDQ